MFVEWSWIVGLLLGATIGSFLNVVIYRMPRGISLSKPANSFCPHCKHRLEIPDLFPLFSWLFLRGRCRHCKAKVPARYFFVELLNGAIWAGIWWQYLIVGSDPGKAIAYALAASTLVAIIFIDWELYIIPDQINAFLFVVGVGYNIWLYSQHSKDATTWGMPSSVAGALVGIGVLWGIAFIGRLVFQKDAMGHGDIKMARGIGALLFPAVSVMSFGIAVMLGAVLGIVQILMLRGGDQGQNSVEGEQSELESEYYPPESLGSLIVSGLAYVFLLDIVGLFVPKFYEKVFGENPYTPIEEDEDFTVGATMIPFGPYLALGAIIAAIFEKQLVGGLTAYWNWANPPLQFLQFFWNK